MGFETKEIYHKQNKKQTNKQPLKTNKQTKKNTFTSILVCGARSWNLI